MQGVFLGDTLSAKAVWQAPTLTFLLCLCEPALPPSHQDKHFRHFPAPASKASQDRSKACSLLPILGTPLCWEQADPKPRAAVSASHSSKLNCCCNHLWEAVETQETAMKQGELPLGEGAVEYFILAEKQASRWWKTSPELCDNTRKFVRQFLLEPLSLSYSSSLITELHLYH